MIGTVNATVTDVQPRIVKEGKPDQKTIYDVVDQAGEKFTAWDKTLAEAAWHLKGQPSIWKVKVEQSGNYTNRTLMEITPVSGGNAMMAQATGTFPSATNASTAMTLSPPIEQAKIGLSEKDRMIHRQAATKVAAVLAKNEIDFWATVDILTAFYETGKRPGLVPQDTPGPEPAFMSPFEPVPDDDIPF